MGKREFKKSKDEVIADCKAIMRRRGVNRRFLIRVIAVNMYLNGEKQGKICAELAVSQASLSKWLNTAEEQGIEGLEEKEHKGRRPRLTEAQMEELKVAVAGKPEEKGYNVWDGPALCDFIKRTYGVQLCVRRCQQLLHEMGFSLIRPQTFPSLDEDNEKAREEFKKKYRGFEK